MRSNLTLKTRQHLTIGSSRFSWPPAPRWPPGASTPSSSTPTASAAARSCCARPWIPTTVNSPRYGRGSVSNTRPGRPGQYRSSGHAAALAELERNTAAGLAVASTQWTRGRRHQSRPRHRLPRRGWHAGHRSLLLVAGLRWFVYGPWRQKPGAHARAKRLPSATSPAGCRIRTTPNWDASAGP